VCDLRDKLEEKDEELGKVKDQLQEAKDKVFAHDNLVAIKDDEINNKVSGLKDSIWELELIVGGQAMSGGHYQSQVITDPKSRIGRQERIAKWYEQEFTKVCFQMECLKCESGFYVGGTEHDLQLVRNFRDKRHVLKVACLACASVLRMSSSASHLLCLKHENC
jgi:hypothetical protein